MDIAAFEAFVAIAEEASFSLAAERLGLSQSAVSKRLSSLEHSLDARLFDRLGRSVHLTEAGAVLLPHARRVLADLAAGRRAIADLAGAVRGRLHVATSHHIGLHRLPPVLRHFTAAYPDVDLDLRFLESEDACAAVAAGDIELAVVTLPQEPSAQLVTEPLWRDPLVFVVGAGHPLAERATVGPADLARTPAILPGTATFTRRIVTAALRELGVEPRVAFETNYLETIKMMVSVGLGWSVLPRTMHDRGELAALAVEGTPGLLRRLGIVRHAGRSAGNAARAFAGVARDHADRAVNG